MSFIDHIEDLRWHIIRSLIAIILGAIVIFVNSTWVFENIVLAPAKNSFPSYKIMCDMANFIHMPSLCMDAIELEFQNIALSGQFMMSFSISFMLGFVIAFPYVFWEFWRFIKPALSEKELKNARGIVLWISLLFFIGILFAYFVIAPFTINFFANYTLSPSFKNIITMQNYYDTLIDLILGVGVAFELPVVVFFLSKIGLLTPETMRSKRRYAILIIVVLAAIITPPDIFSLVLVALPMLVLYQISIVISARVNKAFIKKYQ